MGTGRAHPTCKCKDRAQHRLAKASVPEQTQDIYAASSLSCEGGRVDQGKLQVGHLKGDTAALKKAQDVIGVLRTGAEQRQQQTQLTEAFSRLEVSPCKAVCTKDVRLASQCAQL